MRSFAMTFAGTVSSEMFELHLQSFAGHPHFGQIRPTPVE
jgi:hypothetical protein